MTGDAHAAGGPGEPGQGGPEFSLAGYLGLPLGGFLSELSAGSAAPGGGSAAALSVALGAGLCAMTARLSARQLTRDGAAERAAAGQQLAGQAAALIQADADSFQRVLAARRRNAGACAAALSEAAMIPMHVVELGTQTARLAAGLAVEGNPNLRGDAVTAALLAQAGARAAAVLVRINLAGAADDERLARAGRLLDEADRSVRLAADATPGPAPGGRGID